MTAPVPCTMCGLHPATVVDRGDPLCARCDFVWWNRDAAAAQAALEVLAGAISTALRHVHPNDVWRLAANMTWRLGEGVPVPEFDLDAEVSRLGSIHQAVGDVPVVNEYERGSIAWFNARQGRDYDERHGAEETK